LGTILTGINTYNNAKKVKAKDVKEELRGLSKTGIQQISKRSGTITNPVGSFSVGTAAVVAAVGVTLAGAKSNVDNKNKTSRVINNPTIDTKNYLSGTESFNLLQTNLAARDRVAAGIYYQRNGSRKGLSIAQSDVEFAASSIPVKNIYRNRALSDITRLVNEGYIKINRQTNEVAIIAEKAAL
jgi:hypothetical protein